MIKAPFTPDQVAALNRFQRSGNFHPFTCGSGRRSDAAHLDGEGILVATEAGWNCPYCDYVQNWAHEEMLMIGQEISQESHAAGAPKPQSMLYELCSICKGTGFMTISNRAQMSSGALDSGAACEERPCIGCKRLHVVETGLTARQAEHLAEMETLRQEAGISAAMLRDGRAAGLVKEVERFAAALHRAKAHPDYSYIVAPRDSFIGRNADTPNDQCWERCPEVDTLAPGDECWRRRKEPC